MTSTASAPFHAAAARNPLASADPPANRPRVKTGIPQEFRERPADNALATFLGVFSVGLGLWELFAPKSVAEHTGVRAPQLLRAYGVRELAAGVGLLAAEKPAGWLWARVAGDAVDLFTLAAAYTKADGADRRKAVEAAAAVAGVTLLDVIAAAQHGQ